jgi:hypothetical protein
MTSNAVPPEELTNSSAPESEKVATCGGCEIQLSPRGNAPEKMAKPRLRRHRKRVQLSDAMRAQGIDERTIAEAFAEAVVNLRDTGKVEGKEKALVYVLKECTKALIDRPKRGNEPISVQLIHNIPRPHRGPTEPADEK